MQKHFELGQLVMTRGVADHIEESAEFAKHVMRSLRRYTACDWGEMLKGDAAMNDMALGPDGGRILAAYEHPEQPKLWIITEADRSYSTILFPSEY